jgi:hypothetical protein
VTYRRRVPRYLGPRRTRTIVVDTKGVSSTDYSLSPGVAGTAVREWAGGGWNFDDYKRRFR